MSQQPRQAAAVDAVDTARAEELFQNVENCAKNTVKCKADNSACVCVCVWAVLCCTVFWLVLKAKSHLYSFEINLAFIQGARRGGHRRRNISSSRKQREGAGARGGLAQQYMAATLSGS